MEDRKTIAPDPASIAPHTQYDLELRVPGWLHHKKNKLAPTGTAMYDLRSALMAKGGEASLGGRETIGGFGRFSVRFLVDADGHPLTDTGTGRLAHKTDMGEVLATLMWAGATCVEVRITRQETEMEAYRASELQKRRKRDLARRDFETFKRASGGEVG